ncbi:MAG: TonB family protein [Rhodobacteraceae bacterium]|jgi:protein TonB|nr:TonB family protein [Paracoccaceae bacterium]
MMRRGVEALAFLGLASAVHAGVWIGFGGDGGAESGAGAGGAAPLTLAAADPGMAALVARWDTPPAVAPADPGQSRTARAPSAPDSPPGVPVGDSAVTRPAVAPSPLVAPAALPSAAPDRTPDAAMAETAPAADPVRPRPRPPATDRSAAAEERAGRADAPGPDAPAQRAEGTGDRRSAGQQGQGAARAAPAGTLRALEREWGAAILSRIARRQHYPAGDHGSGTARVSLTVGRDGRLQGVGLAASSGSAALDRAALEAVRRAGRFPPAPAELDKASYVFAVPMTFRRD